MSDVTGQLKIDSLCNYASIAFSSFWSHRVSKVYIYLSLRLGLEHPASYHGPESQAAKHEVVFHIPHESMLNMRNGDGKI